MPVQMDDRVTENWFHSSEKGKTGWAKEKISDLIGSTWSERPRRYTMVQNRTILGHFIIYFLTG